MRNDIKIKKNIRNIYSLDFDKCKLDDGDELIIQDGVNEFTELFKLYDFQNNIIVTPTGYTRGLFYKEIGEVINSPLYFPDIVKFNLSIFGLKKNSIYKLTVIARDTTNNNIVTNNRDILVTNSENELLISSDLTGMMSYKEFHGIFRAVSNEESLFFTLGKIAIKNIIVDEVELEGSDEDHDDEIKENSLSEGIINLEAYGLYSPINEITKNHRYTELPKLSGQGINLYFDSEKTEFIIERDNREEVVKNSLSNSEYIVDINTDKFYSDSGILAFKAVTESSSDISPNTLKSGYIRFAMVDLTGKKIPVTNLHGRIYILINKLF